MGLKTLLERGRAIWPDEIVLPEILVALGVVQGDICRWQCGAPKEAASQTDEELKTELGNLFFSTIRWRDLSFDPKECVSLAVAAQEKFCTKL